MEKLAAFFWGVPMMILLLAVGAILTIGTRFVQVRKLPAAIGQVGKSLKSDDRSGFRSVCTALAATVGTGNIAGVLGAIALGGPGAVFWMWVAAFFGMATKYAEVVLAKRYRTPTGQGGPMYYIRLGMGERYRWLAAVFAFAGVLASVGVGNMTQTHTIASSLLAAIPTAEPRLVALITGICAALLVGLVTVGGVKCIGQITEKLVPLMAGLYILSMLAVVAICRHELGRVLQDILVGAFSPRAVLGGGAGIGMGQAVRWGISRGVFSNEAGMGSAPIAHASSALPAHEQGLLGIFEVFFDTIVLCSLTAFAVLSSGVPIAYGSAAGVELASQALASVFGTWAPAVCALICASLALATLVGWQMYGYRCAEYLWGIAGAKGLSVCYAAFAALGATMDLARVWAVADVCMGLMCLPNLIALLALHRQIQADCKTDSFSP